MAGPLFGIQVIFAHTRTQFARTLTTAFSAIEFHEKCREIETLDSRSGLAGRAEAVRRRAAAVDLGLRY
jgi:hypothetical protein